LFASFFLINGDSFRYLKGNRSQFRFIEQDGYFTTDPKHREKAVAYHEASMWEMMSAAGFERDKVAYGRWMGRSPAESGQDLVICSKPRRP